MKQQKQSPDQKKLQEQKPRKDRWWNDPFWRGFLGGLFLGWLLPTDLGDD